MLGLQLPTEPRWVDIVEKNIEEILVDHAYCEQKAASTAISFIIGFPEKTELVQAMINHYPFSLYNNFTIPSASPTLGT
jgi:tRNA-(ms[2]io[6]A)-hydroxylase